MSTLPPPVALPLSLLLSLLTTCPLSPSSLPPLSQVLGKDTQTQNAVVAKAVSGKVDETLRAETRAFFAQSVQKNIKRWTVMKEKFNRESQQFKNDTFDEFKASGGVRRVAGKGPGPGQGQGQGQGQGMGQGQNQGQQGQRHSPSVVSPPSVPTPEELDLEAERLEVISYLNPMLYPIYASMAHLPTPYLNPPFYVTPTPYLNPSDLCHTYLLNPPY
jgi:hypothetical protein